MTTVKVRKLPVREKASVTSDNIVTVVSNPVSSKSAAISVKMIPKKIDEQMIAGVVKINLITKGKQTAYRRINQKLGEG